MIFLIFLWAKIGVKWVKVRPPERDLEPLVPTVGSGCSCFAGKRAQTSNCADLHPFLSLFHRARRGTSFTNKDFVVSF